jgi:DNA-binding PadR family transcriptional regulator
LSRDDLTFISYSVLTLVGHGGASPHDFVRMVEGGGRIYRSASPSQYYAEPKRLERLGYLTSSKEPGRTRDRTVYHLTEKGRGALRAWMDSPAAFPGVAGEPVVRMLAADLVGERAVRESLLAMREELAWLQDELTKAEERAETLPHRRKYLLLNHRLARGVIDTYEEWLDEVERELYLQA